VISTDAWKYVEKYDFVMVNRTLNP